MDAPNEETTSRPPTRVLRLLLGGGKVLALVGTFSAGLCFAALLHGNTGAFRRGAAYVGNAVLASRFEGRVRIGDVTHLALGRTAAVRVATVDLIAPDGTRVLEAETVEATIDLSTLLRSLRDGAPDIFIESATVQRARLRLDVDAAGKPEIANVFRARAAPTTTAAPKAAGGSEGPKNELRVRLPQIAIGTANVRGNLVTPALDGDAEGLLAHVTVEHDTASVILDDGRVTLRSPNIPGAHADLVATAKGSLAVALATTRLVGKVDVDGAYVVANGKIPVRAHVEMDGDKVAASADVDSAEPDLVHDAFASVSLARPITVHASAKGVLPSVAIDVQASAGPSELLAEGEIDLREGHAFRLDATAKNLDASLVGASMGTDLSGRLHAEGALAAGGAVGTFRATTAAGTIRTETIPATVIEGRFEQSRITATVRASEPGVDGQGKVDLDLDARRVSFDLQARSSSLRALSRAPNRVGGAASGRVQGEIDLVAESIRATATASADNLGVEGITARRLEASGALSGPLRAPVLDVVFAGNDVAIKAKEKAPLSYPTANGRARIAFVPSLAITNVVVNVGAPNGSESVVASAASVRFDGGVVEARGLVVAGLGEPLELDVSGGEGAWRVRAKGRGVEMRRLAALSGIKELTVLPDDTRASLDVDISQTPAGASGHFDVVVTSEKGLGTGPVTTEVHGTLDRGRLKGRARLSAPGFGEVAITEADLNVPGRLDARSVARATGTIELRGSVDLSKGAALFAGENVESMAGIASFEARIERGDPNALPAVRTTIRTDGLAVAYGDPATPNAKTIRVEGVELLAHAAWDGRTEDGELAVLSWDARGLIGTAGAKARIPLAAWATGAEKLNRRVLGKLEVDALAALPVREVSELPEFLRPLGLRGGVGARLAMSGTIAHPRVAFSGTVAGLQEAQRPRGAARIFQPLDGTIESRWDGEQGAITFALDERVRAPRSPSRESTRGGSPTALAEDRPRRPRKPGHLRGLVNFTDVRMTDLLRGRAPSELPWKASAEIEVESLNLAALPLGSLPLTGALSGRLRLRDVNTAGSFEVTGHVDNFGAGGAQVQSLDLTAGGRNASLFANITMTDATGGETSRATFQIASQSLQVNGIDVGWDAALPTRIDYAVQNARLALLAPLVKSLASELDGRANGAGSVSLDSTGQVFEGGLAISDGRLYVNTFGEEITNLSAALRFEKSGAWRIEEATGRIGTGDFRASGSGRMKGLALVDAKATLIAAKGGIPLSSEGATFAEATGEVQLEAKMSDDRRTLLVTVDVPRTNLQLPDRSPQRLEALDADRTIDVGVRRRTGALDTSVVRKGMGGTGSQRAVAKQAGEALVTRITVSLGDQVHLEGRGLDVVLGGRTLVELADELAVTGRIDLRSGTIEVHGRRFAIDRGTVTFSENADPSNPTVIAAAYWDAPDRTRVWVEFAGPLKTGKLSLRSEPAYSKNEILSVLLFGRPDPNMAAGATDKTGDASGATAIGTGFVASDLNRVLSEIDENLDIETDTLSGNRARTKLGRSFFDRRLKVQVGYAPGTTYREPDTTFVFLNWQFIPKWSVIATRGNRGTSILDILFQHRY